MVNKEKKHDVRPVKLSLPTSQDFIKEKYSVPIDSGNGQNLRALKPIKSDSFLLVSLKGIDWIAESLQKFHGISASFRTFSTMVFQEELWKSTEHVINH
ncbi:hypothetical protein MAR_019509 [Mya arenaria]|uniref:Uncharacterized protein n=1 Tax=Mya arenaria TaxID=6604 RepID=A0ABY7E2R7_MYAAR|nr:hypothetical protein MAR_019509 [Mya arenaria]